MENVKIKLTSPNTTNPDRGFWELFFVLSTQIIFIVHLNHSRNFYSEFRTKCTKFLEIFFCINLEDCPVRNERLVGWQSEVLRLMMNNKNISVRGLVSEEVTRSEPSLYRRGEDCDVITNDLSQF